MIGQEGEDEDKDEEKNDDKDDMILMTRIGLGNATRARVEVQGSRTQQRKGRRQEGEGGETRLQRLTLTFVEARS